MNMMFESGLEPNITRHIVTIGGFPTQHAQPDEFELETPIWMESDISGMLKHTKFVSVLIIDIIL